MLKNKSNNKGFTLIELLAVIVVLAIILVITVPMVLNTLGDTRQNALAASATSASDFYRNQMQIKVLNPNDGEPGFLDDFKELKNQNARCITAKEADILGLNSNDYLIGTGECTTDSENDGGCTNCSSVSWTEDGKVTVVLRGATGGQFDGLVKSGSK